MAVLIGERSATVYAVRDSHLAKLTQAGLERLLSKHPQATTLLFARKVAVRLKHQISGQSRAERGIATVAVAPAGRGVPISEFSERLASALSVFGRTLHLGSERLDRDLGRRGAAQVAEIDAANIKLVEWLDSLDRQYRFVVYESDEVDSPWTRRCLRQSDHILIVGNASANPAPGPLEKQILEADKGKTGTRMSLVLLYGDASQQPRDTSKWLAERRVERHHHIRLSSQSDFERLARFLTGRAVGLVLGGGSARGLAHPGVIRALDEAGIPIDALGGTSMGALIAGEYLEGYDYERMVRVAGEGTLSGLHDLTFPALAFLAGRKRGELVHNVWGDKQIEDFWLPFFCVSANLTRAAMQVHTRGSVVKSMAATCSIPGMLPPVVWDSDLLVDGGLMSNVPVDVMRSFPDVGTVIAVDVSPPLDQLTSEDYGFGYSGWRALWTRINPFSKQKSLLNIFAILMRTIDFGGASHKSQIVRMADLYIQIPLEQFLVNDFKRGMEMAEVAYRFRERRSRPGRLGPQKRRKLAKPGRHCPDFPTSRFDVRARPVIGLALVLHPHAPG